MRLFSLIGIAPPFVLVESTPTPASGYLFLRTTDGDGLTYGFALVP